MNIVRQYIKTILNEVGLTAREINAYGSRRYEIFLNLLDVENGFEIENNYQNKYGKNITIPTIGNEKLVSALESQDPQQYKDAFKYGVLAIGENGEEIELRAAGHIRKTLVFGGLGGRSRLEKENLQISQINDALEEIGKPITINLGKRTAEDVVKCISVAGTPKADAALINSKGETVGFISLKYADKPSEMQQWGGLTPYGDNPAVKDFVKDVRVLLKQSPSDRLYVAYYRKIEDEDSGLAKKLVYGAGDSPENTVDLVIASQKKIEIRNGKFLASHIFYSPQLPTGEWSPTFYATFRSNRRDLGLSNTRVGCYPLGFRKNKKELPLSGNNED